MARLFLFILLSVHASLVLALQEAAVVVGSTPEAVKATAEEKTAPTTPQADTTAGPTTASKPGEATGDAKPADGSPPSTENAEPKVIRRDQQTVNPGDAEEFEKATLGEDGKVAFQFRNQTWPELVLWLSDISDEPIDWQELPADRVNITTPGRYNVDEVRDLLNRHLLGRGYTLLKLDGGLTIVKCDALNPSLVPRVDEFALAKTMPHSFVRISLDVGWLSAEKLAAELKPMMSKNGTLAALTTTNRIEAMDSAITLRHVADLLSQERDAASREALAPEFKLRHLPASEAKAMLESFLGIEKKKDVPLTPQEMAMLQQMQQQNGGQPPPAQEKKSEISIVANSRQNSVIIMAPPDRIAIATEFLKRIDVPSSSIASLADVKSRIQVFRLASLDPEKLIEIIEEMSILEPTTRTRVDNENRAIIVSGSAADRYIIDQLIQRLDGTGRKFEVLQLRRLDARDVAESVSFLMGQEKEEDSSSRNRGYSYMWGGMPEEEKKPEDKFRVAANTKFRQVLLWANDAEMEEVRNLLIKLGELPPPGGDSRTVRILDASPTPETLEYLKRIKAQWNQIAPNTIELPDDSSFTDPLKGQDSVDEDNADESDDGTQALPDLPKEQDEKPRSKDNARDQTALQAMPNDSVHLTTLQDGDDSMLTEPTTEIDSAEDFDRVFGRRQRQELASPEGKIESQAKDAAPIKIEIDSSGNLLLSSRDTDALDRLESMMLQLAPPKRPYRVFKIRFASASWMRLNLEDYFKEDDDEKDNTADSFYRWYWDEPEEEEKGPEGLGKGNKLRFIDDIDTNTIVVNGADSEQLKIIGELIEIWDVPEPVNKRKTRFTRLLPVRFGKADKIATTVKDAYRDLLSSNDRAFEQNQGGGGADGNANARKQTPKNREGNGSELVDTAGDRESGGSDFTFKGKLSIGIDEVGNTLLISAEGEPLLDLVCDMVKQLDDASRPSGDVQVVRMSGGVSAQALEAALRAFDSGASPASEKPARNQPPETPTKEEAAVTN
jgi:type II secretory pathway component GspD/PulD (secretin)